MSQTIINFSVDARLLQELGERLVGRPATALAELVKNAYDADATFAEITLDPEKPIGSEGNKGEIVVRDDGHGMTFADFRDFWMRVGTTHKSDAKKHTSPYFGRQMTGSKGVGRLTVQFLAHRLELITVPKATDEPWIWAYVDWDEAVQSGDLTSATVVYEVRTDAPPFAHGTELRLEWLKQSWGPQESRDLAREIWWLQPPFRREAVNVPLSERFEIRFVGARDAFEEFRQQLDAVLKIQMARVVGTYHEGQSRIAIEFWERGSKVITYQHEHRLADIEDLKYQGREYDPESDLRHAEFEIRIYRAKYKQSYGISVEELREYLERFAGVHVYDGPFRLPYYGDFRNDWLEIEADHSQRAIVSKLLPKPVQDAFKDVKERLRYLPTMRRMIGTVKINTSKEANLEITVARDRLKESRAHEDLRYIVRFALDLYAYHAARRAMQVKAQVNPTEKPSEALRRVEDEVTRLKPNIAPPAYEDLTKTLREVSKSVTASEKAERDAEMARIAYLAPLATAGISALAIQHELRKQFGRLDELITTLQRLHTGNPIIDDDLQRSAHDLQDWLDRARTTNRLFDYMTGETMSERMRYRARVTIESVLEQMTFMTLGISVDISDLDPNLYLPHASFAEWGAIFQNIFSNAFNAMYGCPTRTLGVSSQTKKNQRSLMIQDTGIGVDSKQTERLFQPFERGIEDDPARRRLGYGGTGLGLTIVRLLCDRIGCIARFAQPSEGFSTAFVLEWDEKIARRETST